MATKRQPTTGEIRRVGKFGAVGIINTVIDFSLFNLLSKFVFMGSGGVIPSNIVSTTTSMIFSFFANRGVVFKAERGSMLKQAVIFFAVTAVGLYIIQTGIIYILVHVWTTPLDLAVRIIRHLGIYWLNDQFYINNGAKAFATVASMTWNYLMYKKVVFR